MATRCRSLRRLGPLALLLCGIHAEGKQQLPDLERSKDSGKDKDIVLEGDNTVWMKLPSPFFKPGDVRPYPPRQNYADQQVRNASRIVVLVASLRESKLVKTLVTMFNHAVLPSRVFAGIVQQNSKGDKDALEELCRELKAPLKLKEVFRGRGNLHMRQSDEDAWGHGRYTAESLAACEPAVRVRMHRMDVDEAKGPAYARSRQPQLLSGAEAQQDFCLQIDAHTLFVKGWDEHLIGEWALTQNEYAILTTYPISATRTDGEEPVNDQGRWAMPHLCKATFEGPGIVRNSIAGAVANLQSPAFTKFWAAGLSFGKCHAERDVPNDPGLTHIFSGEEFSRAARLWTNGYDMYSMMRPYVFTYYGGDKGGRGGWQMNHSERQQASERLATLLWHHGVKQSSKALGSLKGYNLGTRRKYDDYMRLTGVDTVHQKIKDTPCAITAWTPWQAAAQPPYEMLADSPARLSVGADPGLEPQEPEGRSGRAASASAAAVQAPRLPAAAGSVGGPVVGWQLIIALAVPIMALGLLVARRRWQRRSSGKST
mmetsp:Transcript_33173/g.95391  ORF Transcript_33173/g.95391 Transcript_33173/m.95391 type:complete len:541 (-) Transcript_33173:7-1629(-)